MKQKQTGDQYYLKVDPITGHIIAEGRVPAGETLGETDHEGLLIFPIEPGATAHDYQFDREAFVLVKRANNQLVELRRRLAQERRPATKEELALLASSGLADTQAG